MTVGQPVDAASSESNIGEVRSGSGRRLDEAESIFREALRVSKASGDRFRGPAAGQLGRAVSRAGRHEEALTLLGRRERRLQGVGAQADVLETDAEDTAEFYLFMGRTADARSSRPPPRSRR